MWTIVILDRCENMYVTEQIWLNVCTWKGVKSLQLNMCENRSIWIIVITDKYGMTKRLVWGGCHKNHYKYAKIHYNYLKLEENMRK